MGFFVRADDLPTWLLVRVLSHSKAFAFSAMRLGSTLEVLVSVGPVC